MQITNDTSEARYTATEGQTDFVFDFPVYLDTHMTVFTGTHAVDGSVAWTERELGVDWSMTQTDAEAKTGKVVFTSGLSEGDKVLLLRSVPLTQLSQYVEDDRLPASVFQGDINLGIMIDQQHARQLSKCFKLPDTSDLEDLTVPEPEEGTVLYWVSSTELGNRRLADLGTVTLPVEVSQGGTGADNAEDALNNLDPDLLKADSPDVLRAVYGDEAQEIIDSTLTDSNPIARNHILWTPGSASCALHGTVVYPYDGVYVFHLYPTTATSLFFGAAYNLADDLADPDFTAAEIRFVVEVFNGNKSIVSLQNIRSVA